jgi:hypothetical protein
MLRVHSLKCLSIRDVSLEFADDGDETVDDKLLLLDAQFDAL